MQGTLSLGVLVAALVALAAWAGYLLVRLYRACPIARLTPAPPTRDHTEPGDATEPCDATGPYADDRAYSEDQPSTPEPVA